MYICVCLYICAYVSMCVWVCLSPVIQRAERLWNSKLLPGTKLALGGHPVQHPSLSWHVSVVNPLSELELCCKSQIQGKGFLPGQRDSKTR